MEAVIEVDVVLLRVEGTDDQAVVVAVPAVVVAERIADQVVEVVVPAVVVDHEVVVPALAVAESLMAAVDTKESGNQGAVSAARPNSLPLFQFP
jgi:hypothetical protein